MPGRTPHGLAPLRPPWVAVGQWLSSKPCVVQPSPLLAQKPRAETSRRQAQGGGWDRAAYGFSLTHFQAGEVMVVEPQFSTLAMMAAGPPVSMPWMAYTLPSPHGASKW